MLNNALSYQEITLAKEAVIATDYLAALLIDFELGIKHKKVSTTQVSTLQDEVVTIDKFHFTTALFDILENAVEYNGEHVKIVIKVSVDDFFVVSISDNGIGIPDNCKGQIFDKFYRVANQEIHNVKGLGLGLYYANQIVKAHDGILSMVSEQDVGTTFNTRIPNS